MEEKPFVGWLFSQYSTIQELIENNLAESSDIMSMFSMFSLGEYRESLGSAEFGDWWFYKSRE